MSIDTYSEIKVTKIIAPISPAATGTISGAVIDTANYASNTFIVMAGAQTTTSITVTPIIKSGTATGSLTSAVDADLIGTEAAAALSGTAGAGTQSKIGYIGSNRYVTCNLAVTGAATGVYSIMCIQSNGRKGPQS